jgi:hypothetical protein
MALGQMIRAGPHDYVARTVVWATAGTVAAARHRKEKGGPKASISSIVSRGRQRHQPTVEGASANVVAPFYSLDLG